MIRHIDLFSGIGGFAYGLEATGGFRTIAFVEINPFCRAILAKHWPNVPCAEDIKDISLAPGMCDILTGGFPCQDVSTASPWLDAVSIIGSRSGLWFEYYRLIQEARPAWVIIENVEALLRRGLAVILQQLAALGYDVEWRVIPAYAVGLPHKRNRLWVVAHARSKRLEGRSAFPLRGLEGTAWGENVRRASLFVHGWDADRPKIRRSRNGLPRYVDRITALGNAVVPQIPYLLGSAILEYLNG